MATTQKENQHDSLQDAISDNDKGIMSDVNTEENFDCLKTDAEGETNRYKTTCDEGMEQCDLQLEKDDEAKWVNKCGKQNRVYDNKIASKVEKSSLSEMEKAQNDLLPDQIHISRQYDYSEFSKFSQGQCEIMNKSLTSNADSKIESVCQEEGVYQRENLERKYEKDVIQLKKSESGTNVDKDHLKDKTKNDMVSIDSEETGLIRGNPRAETPVCSIDKSSGVKKYISNNDKFSHLGQNTIIFDPLKESRDISAEMREDYFLASKIENKNEIKEYEGEQENIHLTVNGAKLSSTGESCSPERKNNKQVPTEDAPEYKEETCNINNALSLNLNEINVKTQTLSGTKSFSGQSCDIFKRLSNEMKECYKTLREIKQKPFGFPGIGKNIEWTVGNISLFGLAPEQLERVIFKPVNYDYADKTRTSSENPTNKLEEENDANKLAKSRKGKAKASKKITSKNQKKKRTFSKVKKTKSKTRQNTTKRTVTLRKLAGTDVKTQSVYNMFCTSEKNVSRDCNKPKIDKKISSKQITSNRVTSVDAIKMFQTDLSEPLTSVTQVEGRKNPNPGIRFGGTHLGLNGRDRVLIVLLTRADGHATDIKQNRLSVTSGQKPITSLSDYWQLAQLSSSFKYSQRQRRQKLARVLKLTNKERRLDTNSWMCVHSSSSSSNMEQEINRTISRFEKKRKNLEDIIRALKKVKFN